MENFFSCLPFNGSSLSLEELASESAVEVNGTGSAGGTLTGRLTSGLDFDEEAMCSSSSSPIFIKSLATASKRSVLLPFPVTGALARAFGEADFSLCARFGRGGGTGGRSVASGLMGFMTGFSSNLMLLDLSKDLPIVLKMGWGDSGGVL